MVTEREARNWIALDHRNSEVLFPYLNGEDVTTRPDSSPSRWTIDFFERPEESARTYADPYRRLLESVKAERQKSNRKSLRVKWWQFADKRPALRAAIRELDKVLVIAIVSKTVMPMRVPSSQVFSHRLGVFASDAFTDQAVLSSFAHLYWAIKYSSTLETRVNYSPTDAFLTFPRPSPTEDLDIVGEALDSKRREIMLRRELGLTKLYNLVNDPGLADAADTDVARMREIHVALDEAVMAAYGWRDVPLEHGFHDYRQMTRWTVSPAARVEILDRLLEENHRRAAVQGDAVPVDDEASGDGPAESGDE